MTEKHRLASVDALRGCTVAAMLLVNDPGDWSHVYAPFEHAAWHGCTPTDLIFPFFLFLAGVSIALGILPRIESGAARTALCKAALWRALRIIALGLAINIVAWGLLPEVHLRVPGVLQRIGMCFGAAAWLAIHTRPRIWWMATVALLLGYWIMLMAGGTLAPWDNIASRIDSRTFGSAVYLIDTAGARGHDPEGLLGTLPAIATTVLGLCAGQWLRKNQSRNLLLCSVLALLLGWLWSHVLPFNKNLWTPSFALWCAGWTMLALLAFHWLIDERGLPAIGRRFGVNAIAAYAGSELLQILLPAFGWQAPIYERGFADWISPIGGPFIASLGYAIAFVALWWLIVYVLDRNRVYVKL